ncbi:TfoX/Sxy family protein [Flintibacter muris]|uniref:TfoX/Sxy family protein n=1 Tax=Flintibacter muris TaxID=2941327 RepID=UPI00203F9144|nr:TfoX/Sxy family protein [Flintibacter muris]
MKLTELPNIGPELARLLNEVEVHNSEELQALGAEMALLRMKAQGLDVCFHKLTALEGAIQGVKKSQLTPERKAELREFFDGLPKR